jgi:hypothetical protein
MPTAARLAVARIAGYRDQIAEASELPTTLPEREEAKCYEKSRTIF